MVRFLDIAFTGLGILVIAAAACFAGHRSLSRSEDPAKLAFKWIFSAVLIGGGIVVLRSFPVGFWPVIVLIPAVVLGLLWAPSIGSMVAKPLTGLFDGGDEEVKPQPFYSIAESKRRKGLYEEAAQEVRCQLEKFPGDLTGMLLLGAIMAEDLNDLPGTRELVQQWLSRPGVTPQGAVALLHGLADWELQVGRDPESARACLERIIYDYAGTQYSHQAEQRIAHLPAVEDLRQPATNEPVDLPSGEKYIGLLADFPGIASPGDSEDPESLAQTYVEKLQRHPADVDTREKLAMLYAEHFQRLDMAADQLEQLIALPTETPKHVARWLNLLATMHIRIARDVPAAEKTLRRIIDGFPNSAAATQAFERLASLNLELRATRTTEVKTLGCYETHLGLKQRKL